LKLYTRTLLDSDSKAAELESRVCTTKVREKEAWCVCVCAQRERRDEGTCATTTLIYP
jgi:hypothetical protein